MATLVNAVPLLTAVRDAMFLSGTVGVVDQPTPTMRRIQLRGPRLKGLTWTPGQHVRVQVTGFRESMVRLRPRDTLRTYSIHRADPDAGTLDIVMFDHGTADTPAKRWAATVSVGDQVNVTRPQGNLVVRQDAPYHLFVGEETASVAFAAMLRALPAGAKVHGVVEGEPGATPLPLAHRLTHVHRTDPAADSTVLADALRALELPDRPGAAYLAGEARTIQRLRRILTDERGWDRRQIVTKPFWTPGRTGME
ncbi:siderophore-interacting protein [Mycolicibacterium sp. P1-18]|uniref:siderophore-interacting protein n=1 Tax=Mycolicibacterium sp. P1-18 TaxID=2024615 RepID=UPI0011F33C4C|nr:siderophore-interacting protein [Mycolicibacterium sp. P1-18]KAA0098586.1 siderophore-interacting protein [Mycolicibacterium sp. P1-18]